MTPSPSPSSPFIADMPDHSDWEQQTSHQKEPEVLSALFAPEPTEPASKPEPEKRGRGRPPGTKSPLLVKTAELELEDFFYLRAVINGLPMRDAYARYYGHVVSDAEGRLVMPHGNALIQTSRRLINQIVQQAQTRPENRLSDLVKTLRAPLPALNSEATAREAVALGFEAWIEALPEDMYSENELAERYEEYLQDTQQMTRGASEILSHTAQLKAKLKALNALQTELARRPVPEQDLGLWLHPGLSLTLRAKNVHTLGNLIAFISEHGRHWFRKLNKVGQGRARRIEQWLDFHAETVGEINRTKPEWKTSKGQSPAPIWQQGQPQTPRIIDAKNGQEVLAPSPGPIPVFSVVPLERLGVPPKLDGSQGLFRSGAPNQFGARTDIEAIVSWLRTRAAAGKLKAAEAYRREIERFYLWCLIKTGTPLSSASLAHAQDYQRFLQSIPNEWICSKPVHRSNPMWRPFRGQLNPKSQNYALGVLKHFFRDLIDNGYLTSSPFKSIVETVAIVEPFKIKTSRAFRAEDLTLLSEALAKLSGAASENKDPLKAAKARRTRLVVELAMRTGLRRSELASASLKGMQQAIVDGQPDDAFHIVIVGKGHRARTITLTADLVEQVKAHHNDFRELHRDDPQMLSRFEECLPLITVLETPKGISQESRGGRSTGLSSTATSKSGGLSSSGIYQVFKGFMRYAKQLAASPEQAARIDSATPHWTRHTFAHQVVRDNHNGFGLTHAKQLLGHKSLDTTGQYLTQDLSELTKAAKRINPLRSNRA